MHNMLGPKFRVMAAKSVAIKVVVVAMVGVMGRLMVRLIPWIHISRGIQLMLFGRINQVYMVIVSIELMWFSQKTEFRNCSLYCIV